MYELLKDSWMFSSAPCLLWSEVLVERCEENIGGSTSILFLDNCGHSFKPHQSSTSGCLSKISYNLCACALFVTPWTVARQAPLSMGFSRQEYWSGLPCPPPGDLPNPGMEPTSLVSPALAGGFFTTAPPQKPTVTILSVKPMTLVSVTLKPNTNDLFHSPLSESSVACATLWNKSFTIILSCHALVIRKILAPWVMQILWMLTWYSTLYNIKITFVNITTIPPEPLRIGELMSSQ